MRTMPQPEYWRAVTFKGMCCDNGEVGVSRSPAANTSGKGRLATLFVRQIYVWVNISVFKGDVMLSGSRDFTIYL